MRVALINRTEGDQLPRVGKRQRFQQNRIDHTEDRRVRANADSERKDGNDCKTRRLGELAKSEAKLSHLVCLTSGGFGGDGPEGDAADTGVEHERFAAAIERALQAIIA